MKQSKKLLNERILIDSLYDDIPYAREKLGLANLIRETFRREWNNSEYVKKYGSASSNASNNNPGNAPQSAAAE